EASAIIEWNDEPVRVFLHQPVHKMNLSTDSPFGAGRRLRETFDDVFGRPEIIRKLNDFKPAFRMSDDPNSRMTRPHLPDMKRQKPLMHRAVSFPENHAAVVEYLIGIAAKLFIRIPDRHFLQPQAKRVARIPTEMLIWKKQDPIPTL